MSYRKRHLYGAAAIAIAAAAVAFGATTAHSHRATKTPPNAAIVTVQTNRPGRAIPPGFLGLSLEYPAVTAYAGTDPRKLNPLFLRLTRDLTPGQRPVLRIGGDSTDWTWWPTPNIPKPPGVRITLTQRWLQTTAALQHELNAKLILGIDLEADSRPLAAAEAEAFSENLHGIEALEPGNEPELYPSFGWYRTRADQEVPGRPPTYDFQAFTQDFSSFAQSLPAPLAGPATGSARWMQDIPTFIADQPRLNLLTLHRYPLQQCFTPTDAPTFPTVANLLNPTASQGLAETVAPYAQLAHAHHIDLRIDEMNTISCGASSVGHAKATALWAADALFAMAQAGVDGVNIHTYPGATYDLFSFKRTSQDRWTATVEPEYYGLLMFARAAPAGARLLPVTDPDEPTLRAWATKTRNGRVRLLLLNDSLTRPQTVAISAPQRATLTPLPLTTRAAKSKTLNPPDATTLPPLSAALITFG